MRFRFLTSAVLCCALSPLAAQPREQGVFRPSDLVEIVRLDSTIRLDIRYATANNFMKRPMYAEPRAFLQRPTAAALLRVHRALRSRGLGILVLDAELSCRGKDHHLDAFSRLELLEDGQPEGRGLA